MRQIRKGTHVAADPAHIGKPHRFHAALFDLVPALNAEDESVSAEQFRMLVRSVPMLMVAHLISGITWLAMLKIAGGYALALPIAIILGVTLLLDAGFIIVGRLASVRNRPPYVGARIAVVYAVAIGVSWGLMVVLGSPGLNIGQQFVVAAAFAGAVTVAVAAMSAVPSVLLFHLAMLVIAITGGMGNLLMGLVLLAVSGCVGSVAIIQAQRRLHNARIRRDQDVSARRARHLLAEFEEDGKAWLWETNRDGGLSYISAQLATSLGSTAEGLLGTPLTALIESDELTAGDRAGGDRAGGERTLGFHLSTRLAFSDLMVQARGVEPQRWWSLSGRPAYDDYGRFLGFRGVGADLTEMRRSEAEVNRLARFDSLTGLPNRVVMRQTLDEAVRQDRRKNDHCGLFLLDLDRFKNVNDTLGHPVGDALLQQVAERLIRVVGDRGRVGRLGGDEFNVVLPGNGNRDALGPLADQIIAALSQPYVIEGSSISIGASVGIAVAPDDGDCPDSLVRNADLALYAAKADGKGVYRFYESIMHADAKDRRLLETDLRHALRDGGLEVLYQPVVSTASEQVVGFEALLRWNHPTRGPVSPALFIPIAEEIGLISSIGEWVLRSACMTAAKWPDHVRVAVNLSPLQFANPSLPSAVMSALANAQIPAHRLELEITEGVFLVDSSATDDMFARLQAIGVRLALDDFGTGYSSLGYLKKAPFNKIKIDQSFVRGASIAGSRNAAIIKAIVSLAESLEMETTAEGVETHDEVVLIRSLGCSHIQGYIFGRPMSSDDATRLVGQDGKVERNGFASSRERRLAVLRAAMVRFGGQATNIRLRNMSRGGAMAETSRNIPDNSPVEIILPEGDVLPGNVQWSGDGRMGVKFDTPFPIDRLLATGAEGFVDRRKGSRRAGNGQR
jgi:diguanylate cyclase (GGDEF)-like protein